MSEEINSNIVIDCTGLPSPEPVIKLTLAMVGLEAGAVVAIVADSPDAERDILAWAVKAGCIYISGDGGRYLIRKG